MLDIWHFRVVQGLLWGFGWSRSGIDDRPTDAAKYTFGDIAALVQRLYACPSASSSFGTAY